MAVYERTWRRYSGVLTPLKGRFLVVTKYALADAFASRLFTAFFAVCFLPSVVGLLFIYLSHNAALLQQLGMPPDVNYGVRGHVKAEIEHAHGIYRDNPEWMVVDVTNCAIEETATIILEALREREELTGLTTPPPRVL